MIIKFKYTTDPFGCLSNFSRHKVKYQNKIYFSSEHLYQALKHEGQPALMEKVRLASSPKEAKKIANSFPLPEDWHQTKIRRMLEVCFLKMQQNPEIQEKLLSTNPEDIFVEDSAWDSFWGNGQDDLGANHLGKIWTHLKNTLKLRHSDKDFMAYNV